MSITQFNATYTPEEDRVLFRFNTNQSQEYRLWLTRSVVRDMLALGAQASVAVLAREHPPEQAKAIAEFKHQVKAQEAKFTTFVPATNFPLGAEPLLVHKARIALEKDATVWELVLPKGQVLKLRLTEEMMGQLRLLLQTIEQRARWGLALEKHMPQESQPQKHAADVSANDEPGKVLH